MNVQNVHFLIFIINKKLFLLIIKNIYMGLLVDYGDVEPFRPCYPSCMGILRSLEAS